MEVERVSSECIKPSCPTPEHLRTHKISLLDQFVPSIYIPVVLFYTAGATNVVSDVTQQQRLKLLKQSLSQALTHFYPLAGRIKDKLSIDCNDEGVHYIEAKSSCTVFEFLNQTPRIHKLLPSQATWEEASAEGHVATMQVTSFPCGGMVIGILVSHMVADGAAVSFFLNSWGASSRGAFHSPLLHPNFGAPYNFPQNDACPKDASLMAIFGQFLNKGRISVRRFLFGAEAISKLKTQGSSSRVQNPSRVEAVSSLICKCAAKAFNAKSEIGLDRPTLVTHAVNMRRRASPTFPDSCMGNFVWTAMALASKVPELPDLVIKTREAITSIDSDFVKGFQGEQGSVRYAQVLNQMVEKRSSATSVTGGVNFLNCTSWCNFGLYGVDYGWGKPAWVSCTTVSPDVETVFVNSVLLIDTPLGSGIEAWIYLNEDDMIMLEQDNELLTFATLDPNPLQLNNYDA